MRAKVFRDQSAYDTRCEHTLARSWGLVEAIQADRVTGVIHGASDRRRPGGAALGLQ